MSLVDPKVVDVSCCVGEGGGDGGSGSEGASTQLLASEALATPANLSHHYIIVPAKLRLVTLAAFILSKCKVSDVNRIRYCKFLLCSQQHEGSVVFRKSSGNFVIPWLF